MNTKKKFFIVSMPIIMAICSLFLICDYVDAAPRTAIRSTPTTRKSVSAKTTTQNIKEETPVVESETEIEPEPTELIIENKSNQFDVMIDSVMESDVADNSFAEQIRKQRAALAASESATNVQSTLKSGKNSCDGALRECMMKTCGNDFTKCALDGDTIFGDKLNKCRRDTECTGEEFRLFTAEIKADRDMNVKLGSYNAVLNCGNSYNACIINECGTMFGKCLGKTAADAAIQKCSTIAKDCTEYDSGLVSRFGTVIGRLRENAEKDVKKDEERLYALREKMKNQCTSFGAMFDERTFDCVYTINFFAGENQTTPMASRKRYAGDTFICMQEWFGINTTTYKENAYRETRAQTAASSAFLGSGVGTAAGLVASGAIDRALDTQKAEKSLKEECDKQGGTLDKNGKCILPESEKDPKQQSANTEQNANINNNNSTKSNNTPHDNNVNLSNNNTSGNCTLTFSDGSVMSNVEKDYWYLAGGKAPTNRIDAVIGDSTKRTLKDIIKVGNQDVSFNNQDGINVAYVFYSCAPYANGNHFAFFCIEGYEPNEKPIGTYGDNTPLYTHCVSDKNAETQNNNKSAPTQDNNKNSSTENIAHLEMVTPEPEPVLPSEKEMSTDGLDAQIASLEENEEEPATQKSSQSSKTKNTTQRGNKTTTNNKKFVVDPDDYVAIERPIDTSFYGLRDGECFGYYVGFESEKYQLSIGRVIIDKNDNNKEAVARCNALKKSGFWVNADPEKYYTTGTAFCSVLHNSAKTSDRTPAMFKAKPGQDIPRSGGKYCWCTFGPKDPFYNSVFTNAPSCALSCTRTCARRSYRGTVGYYQN